jgi:uncharacterized protein involved in propanediol utilization
MHIVGCNTDPGGDGVDTVGLPPAGYTRKEIEIFRSLLVRLRRAVATADLGLLGQVATTSARINQRYLPKPQLAPLLDICRTHGGCGVQVAHSGTVAGLIFDPRRPGVADSMRRCADRIGELRLVVTDMRPRAATAVSR